MSINVPNLPLQSLYTHLPLVFAHRGASYDAPANTLTAFRMARQMGADGVELDTSLTADGVPVVIHDFQVDDTTDGTGRVKDFTLDAIKKLDAGSHYDHAFKEERIPTLEESLIEIGPELLVNVELKSIDWRDQGLEKAVLAVINNTNMAGRVLISSFNPLALRRFHRLAPDIPIGFLYAPDSPAYFRLLLAGMPCQAMHPQHDFMDKATVMNLHRRYRINTWTVDNPQRMIALRDLGVDGIITNRPDVLLKALGRSDARTTTAR
jgi:glycerophosphoryl diester phosphodiesterase